METVFDHNITEQEQLALFGEVLTPERYLELVSMPAAAVDAIGALYTLRGDREKAQEYLNRVGEIFASSHSRGA
ncbi:MAG: hypothetical protein IH874_02325 [Candidatus Dadabacteria bacterium]|nr:hypothetical protein [Candidatus Dadabacteria bacterium]